MKVTVLHLMGHLMERQLDSAAGYLLQKELESRGIRVICNAHTNAIVGSDKVEAVLLDDQSTHPADIVVMAAGRLRINPSAMTARPTSNQPCKNPIYHRGD
jgi:nitrite reductase (NADH) large subunit